MKIEAFRSILILALPFLVKYIFLFVFVDFNVFDNEDIKEDILFFILIIVMLHTKLFKNVLLRNILIFSCIFYIVLETSSYLAVSSTFSSSFMYLLLDSNASELSEFISSYINWSIVAVIVINTYLFFLLKRKLKKNSIKYSSLVGLIGAISILFFLKISGLIESNAYHNIVRGTYGYYELHSNTVFEKTVSKTDFKITSNNEVFVLVLGESTTRSHMQIYGYNKETTPLLNSIKDSLYVYDNVISTEVFTLKAVPKMLTFLNNEIDARVSIVQLFNAAGYDTYWLSNQRPISYHDNAISKIASNSKEFKFYNHLIDKNTKILDEIIIKDYSELLKKPGKKMIVLRLMGTHFDYINRYPIEFNKFDKGEHKSKKEKIANQYDNAVLYNDYIVYSLITHLKQIPKSALLYISDHGENVYHNGTDFFGRSEENLTQSMFEIPYILWTSKDFELPEDFAYNPTNLFTADFTFNSIEHLFGVRYKTFNNSKSIFSNSFIPNKRIVLDEHNFDTYFSNKESYE